MKKGLVFRSTGSWYTVQSGVVFYACRIKGRLRLQGIKSTNPVAVGDWVGFEEVPNSDKPEGIIIEIQERQNYIVRKSVNLSKQTHIIAANIDQVFLLITLDNPPTYTAFIDRFLVTAEAYQIPVILVFNKIDSYTLDQQKEIEKLGSLYSKIGYTTMKISALKQTHIEQIAAYMEDKVSMFAGHSGVGKSTLINALAPDLELKTAPISEQHQQGMHTTTFAEMHALPNGMKLIDTPGIKGFGIVEMEAAEIGSYFPEFNRLKSNCKFHNCLHQNEPECAVRTALEQGAIATSRYENYLQLLENDMTYR
ncbi:MAG: ribosome small subunit-dependent GTPase A [Flavobacteriaceae bacterium]